MDCAAEGGMWGEEWKVDEEMEGMDAIMRLRGISFYCGAWRGRSFLSFVLSSFFPFFWGGGGGKEQYSIVGETRDARVSM